MERFSSISLAGWRQFESIDVRLDSPLTVLTGPNGCGKTTILNVLARHFGWNAQFTAVPFLSKRRERKLWSDIEHAIERDLDIREDAVRVGQITYHSGGTCDLMAPPTKGAQYQLQYSNQRTVTGLHIPSQRPVANYFSIDSIPTDPKTIQQHYEEYQQLLFQVYGAASAKNPGVTLKRSLISLAMFGYGNEVVLANPEFRRLFEGFQDVLRVLLPTSLGFQRLEVRIPDIVLVTKSGTFALDSMSGGVSAVFGIGWQIYMFTVDKGPCAVTIDEPENHLHPSMQRELLPALQRAFPRLQFIVATHSPFVVASAPEARVYALTYSASKRIVSQHLESADLAASPNKILREILDVPTTLPVWVEDKVRVLLDAFANTQQTPEDAATLLTQLGDLGVSDSLTELGRKGL